MSYVSLSMREESLVRLTNSLITATGSNVSPPVNEMIDSTMPVLVVAFSAELNTFKKASRCFLGQASMNYCCPSFLRMMSRLERASFVALPYSCRQEGERTGPPITTHRQGVAAPLFTSSLFQNSLQASCMFLSEGISRCVAAQT